MSFYGMIATMSATFGALFFTLKYAERISKSGKTKGKSPYELLILSGKVGLLIAEVLILVILIIALLDN